MGGKEYGLIIYDDSCNNVSFKTVIDKHWIPIKKHPTSYSLQQFEPNNEVTASKQALISFYIGTYNGEVLCDVFLIDESHSLLDRLWLFDNYVQYDGHANIYTLKSKGCSLTLALFTST